MQQVHMYRHEQDCGKPGVEPIPTMPATTPVPHAEYASATLKRTMSCKHLGIAPSSPQLSSSVEPPLPPFSTILAQCALCAHHKERGVQDP
jgi:hypothetical protein